MNVIRKKRFYRLKVDQEMFQYKAGFICRVLSLGRTNRWLEIPTNTIYRYRLSRNWLGCQLLTLHLKEITPRGVKVIKLRPINIAFLGQRSYTQLIGLLNCQTERNKAVSKHITDYHKIPA